MIPEHTSRSGRGVSVLGIMVLASLLTLVSVRGQTLVGPTRAVTAPALSGASADGGSFTPNWSGNGQHVAFVSSANNLVTNGDATPCLNVFVRDLATCTTRLVSVDASGRGGGSGNSAYLAVSSDGQTIAFLSTSTNLIPNTTNAVPNVFVRDMAAGTTTQASISSSGGLGSGGYCLGLEMNPSGQFIVFSSTQTNLVTNSISLTTNIFLRDTVAGTTELLTVQTGSSSGAHGNSDMLSMSADGQRICFYSDALDLVSWSGAPPAAGQVYLRDRSAGATVCPGTNAQSFLGGTVRTFNASLSSDGSAAAFLATNTSKQSALVYYVVANGQSSLVGSNVDTVHSPEISADGRRVAYSAGSNVFMWDGVWGSNTLVSVDTGGLSNGVSQLPAIAADGTKVAFVSSASNLVAGATGGVFQLYVRDLALGVTRLASASSNGGLSSDQGLWNPQLSPDGTRLAFASRDNSLVADDLNNDSDVFVWSWITGQTALISKRETLRPSSTDRGLPLSVPVSISPNGRFFSFSALDGNLVPGDTNGWADVFIRDMVTGVTRLVSGDGNGLPTTNGPASSPTMSADGCYVAFLRGGPRAQVGQTGDVFIRDLQTGALTLVTATNGIGTGNALTPVFRSNGLYVAFCASNQLAANDINQRADVYIYDSQHATNILVSVATNGFSTDYDSSAPVFSPDGQWVVFQSTSPSLAGGALGTSSVQLYARNIASNLTYHISYSPGGIPLAGDNSNAVVSADSRYVAFKSATTNFGNPICLHDFRTGLNQIVCSNCFSPSISSGASKVAFVSTNGGQQICVISPATGETNLVSVASDGVSAGNGRSWAPQLSPDGRFVVFCSQANNLVANDANLCADVYVRDLLLSNTIAVSRDCLGGSPANASSVNPILAADGRTIVFESFASDLSPSDFNAKRDLFTVRLGIGDSDHDGMDDDWEMTYFGDLSHDGSADTDGDGLTDLQEFRAGTNPTDNTSVLRSLAVTVVGGRAVVYWSAIPGRNYRVEYKDGLAAATWTSLVDSIPAVTTTGSVIDETAADSAQRFYRVSALP